MSFLVGLVSDNSGSLDFLIEVTYFLDFVLVCSFINNLTFDKPDAV